jgi:hypothetical protein
VYRFEGITMNLALLPGLGAVFAPVHPVRISDVRETDVLELVPEKLDGFLCCNDRCAASVGSVPDRVCSFINPDLLDAVRSIARAPILQ